MVSGGVDTDLRRLHATSRSSRANGTEGGVLVVGGDRCAQGRVQLRPPPVHQGPTMEDQGCGGGGSAIPGVPREEKIPPGGYRQGEVQRLGEPLGTLEGDPWGRPYRIVRNKLRRAGPPTAETLEPGFLGEVVDTLFPSDTIEEARPPEDPGVMEESPAWSEDLEISEEELNRAVDRMRRRNTAPGPDGISGRVWLIALPVLGERLRHLFNRCLRYAKFPSIWKEAGLVLIPKAGKPPDDPSAQRPICVIPEEAKLLERVVAARLTSHMTGVGPDLETSQYGFRPGRSTV